MAWCSALSPHAEVSESSVEHLEVLESVNSNDPAYRAARENRFRDFDLECQSPPHGAAAALRLRGKLRTRELVELRRLLEGDTRFSLLLDRHCKAVHELIDMKNPTPVLAVLAGLVWSSLSIAWELDTSHMPKARMKMELEELRRQLAKVLDDLSHARTRYLKELVSHREKLRRLENTEEIERLVYEEEPVMFYEPLNYLDDDTKMHVAEVIEEKLKLLLGRLQTPAPKDMKSFLAIPEDMQQPKQDPAPPQRPTRDEALDDLDEQAEQLAKRERELHIKEVQLKAQAEELLAKRQKVEGELSQRLEEAEARHAKTQMMLSEFKANFQQAQAHERFGVHGQCCFVVRPDHHVGFRCEPIRSGAIWRYFRQTCGISHGRNEEAPLSSHVFDPLPALVWTLSLLLILYFIFF